MIFEGYLDSDHMHLVSYCAYQREPITIYLNLWKHFLKKHLPFCKRGAQILLARSVDTPEILWFSYLTVIGCRRPLVILCPFNTPSVPLAVRKTLRICVFDACLQLPEVLTLPHWFQAEMVSDSHSVWHKAGICKKSAQMCAIASPLIEGCIKKSLCTYQMISLRAQLCMQQT